VKPRYLLSTKAKSDLVEIARYTEEHWGIDQRNRYLTLLDSCFRQLADAPLKGRDCSDIRAGYRKFSIGRHTIYYRQQGENIFVVRVLHSSMDAATRLAE
jgi:toxin ParE1/3/4